MSPKESPLGAFRAGGGSEDRQRVCLFSGKRVRRRGEGMEFDPRYSSGYFSVQICTEKGVSLHPSLTPPLHHSPPKKYMGEGRKDAKTNKFAQVLSTMCSAYSSYPCMDAQKRGGASAASATPKNSPRPNPREMRKRIPYLSKPSLRGICGSASSFPPPS